MNTTILIFILLIYGLLIYSFYQLKANASDRKFKLLRKHISRQKIEISGLRQQVNSLEIAFDARRSDAQTPAKSLKSANNFEQSELRHIEEMKKKEIITVNGQPVK